MSKRIRFKHMPLSPVHLLTNGILTSMGFGSARLGRLNARRMAKVALQVDDFVAIMALVGNCAQERELCV
jgi:hypothetical protein